jgi:hypothetical protein
MYACSIKVRVYEHGHSKRIDVKMYTTNARITLYLRVRICVCSTHGEMAACLYDMCTYRYILTHSSLLCCMHADTLQNMAARIECIEGMKQVCSLT